MTTEAKQHTIRLPKQIFDQIESRATMNRRSVNQEIVVMLKNGLDLQVANDRATLDALIGKDQPTQQ